MKAICQFCGEEKKLIKAHIIPRSFYVGNEESEMKLIPFNTNQHTLRSPSGVYDKNILCRDCEKYFNEKFDEPAYLSLIRSDPEKLLHDGERSVNIYKTIDSKLTYLFILSMLWRAGVSSHQFFESVSLGCYGSKIRRYLLEHNVFDIDSENDIKVCLFEYDKEDIGLISPIYKRFSGINYYRFYFKNFLAIIKVDKRSVNESFNGLYLTSKQPTFSIVRDWNSSKEEDAMRKRIKRRRRKTF